MNAPFEPRAPGDLLRLIEAFPLAWVMPSHVEARLPSLLPLVPVVGADGRLERLIGHMARRSPLHPALVANPQALILFQGPQGYVSPAHVAKPDWIPTWNFAQARIAATVTFHPEGGDEALNLLVEHMDRHEPNGWRPRDVGERYRMMEQQVIAFDADVTHVEARFKLAQDETLRELSDILARHPDPELVDWMRWANRHRL